MDDRQNKSKKKGNRANLTPVTTKDEAKERGHNGGVKSGQARKEKKTAQEVYQKVMAARFNVVIDGKKQTLDWDGFVTEVVKGTMIRMDSSSAAMLKEIRAGTDGEKTVFGLDSQSIGEAGGTLTLVVEPKKKE